jgi:hypothetical protein
VAIVFVKWGKITVLAPVIVRPAATQCVTPEKILQTVLLTVPPVVITSAMMGKIITHAQQIVVRSAVTSPAKIQRLISAVLAIVSQCAGMGSANREKTMPIVREIVVHPAAILFVKLVKTSVIAHKTARAVAIIVAMLARAITIVPQIALFVAMELARVGRIPPPVPQIVALCVGIISVKQGKITAPARVIVKPAAIPPVTVARATTIVPQIAHIAVTGFVKAAKIVCPALPIAWRIVEMPCVTPEKAIQPVPVIVPQFVVILSVREVKITVPAQLIAPVFAATLFVKVTRIALTAALIVRLAVGTVTASMVKIIAVVRTIARHVVTLIARQEKLHRIALATALLVATQFAMA